MHFGSKSSHHKDMLETVYLFYVNKRKNISKNGQNHPYITNAKDIIFRFPKGKHINSVGEAGGVV